jgi:hypothetical protein
MSGVQRMVQAGAQPLTSIAYVSELQRTGGVRIPIYSGRVFRREAGHRSDLKPAIIPK